MQILTKNWSRITATATVMASAYLNVLDEKCLAMTAGWLVMPPIWLIIKVKNILIDCGVKPNIVRSQKLSPLIANCWEFFHDVKSYFSEIKSTDRIININDFYALIQFLRQNKHKITINFRIKK